MPIFDVPKERLSELDDADLRELVSRLAEAERVAQGGHRTEVRWGGAQTAADGGIDVEARHAEPGFVAGAVLKRPWVGIQVKRGAMGPADIGKEMRPDGALRPVIADLARAGGSYLIVSGAEDCSHAVLERRRKAMRDAVASHPDEKRLHTDFVDRGHLATWLRGHPGVVLWARDRLGLPSLEGWHPHGRWTATPAEASDDLICEEGLRVHLPGRGSLVQSIPEALDAVRALVRESCRAIRIAGLSGVGKSRLVQALFEEGAGGKPLPRSQAIYADVGAAVEPRAERMLDILIERGEPVVLVVDNCPPDAHARLAERLVKAETPVRLVTVEYDVRDDRPETTDVVRIEAEGPAIAEQLVRRRHPRLSQFDARRVANLAGGNARLALALAHASADAGTLSAFTDAQLFDRLFVQRQDRDPNLKEAAEALSLVVSFHVEGSEADDVDELEILSGPIDQTKREMRRAVRDLQDRGLAQARGPWRAVLPQALANRLARDALRVIPINDLDTAFGQPQAERLLTSFARRLAQLHDVPEAAAIVRGWLAPGGRLGDLRAEGALDLLATVAHLAPKEALPALESLIELGIDNPTAMPMRDQEALVRIVRRLAHGALLFGRSCELLIRLAAAEGEGGRTTHARGALKGLFALYLSGTMAATETRAAVLRRCLFDLDPTLVAIGADMLDATLENHFWSGDADSSYDARPDAHGWKPSGREAKEWFEGSIAIAADGAASHISLTARTCRRVLAGRLGYLWKAPALRPALEAAARTIDEAAPWHEGWLAARKALHLDAIRKKEQNEEASAEPLDPNDRARLAALAAALEPRDLATKVRAQLHGTGASDWHLDDEFGPEDRRASRERMVERVRDLGRTCADDPDLRNNLGADLFRGEGQHHDAFGRGLGEAASDLRALWDGLRDIFLGPAGGTGNAGVLVGVLDAVRDRDPSLADEILQACVDDPRMHRVFPILLSGHPVSARDLDRAIQVLRSPTAVASDFEGLAWRDGSGLADVDRARLLEAMSAAPHGAATVLDALSMLRFSERDAPREWSEELRTVGIEAALRVIREGSDHMTNAMDHDMVQALRGCLVDDTEIIRVIDAVVGHAERRYGHIWDLDETVAMLAAKAPARFLDRTLSPTDSDEGFAWVFFHGGVRDGGPLKDVPPDELVTWCRAGNDPGRWARAARAIQPFEAGGESGSLRLNDQARALLGAAPDVGAVVDALADHLVPMSWSGSGADVIEARSGALAALRSDPRPEVREVIEPHLEAAATRAARERDQERRDMQDSEQRFE